MSRSLILSALGLAALALTPAAALAGTPRHATAARASAASRASVPTRGSFTVVEHALTDAEIPVASGGADDKGDPLTFTNPVYDAADRSQVGHDEGFCTRLDPHKGIWECLWTTFLPAGEITVQGPFYDTRDSVLAVTGGTGAYRNARGQMKLHAFDSSKRYDFSFQLS